MDTDASGVNIGPVMLRQPKLVPAGAAFNARRDYGTEGWVRRPPTTAPPAPGVAVATPTPASPAPGTGANTPVGPGTVAGVASLLYRRR